MIKNFEEYSSEEINEKRMFTLSEIRKKATDTLKSLGIKVPSEEEIKDMMEKLKKFIIDRQMGVIQEGNLERSVKGMSKYGIDPGIEYDYNTKEFVQRVEQHFGSIATGPTYPWIPAKALKKGDNYAFLLVPEDGNKVKTILTDFALNIEDQYNSDKMDMYEEEGYELYWFDPDIINENDNLERSYKGGSKFGITKDLDAVFRPDWLVYTRREIARTILEDAYPEEYDDLITEKNILEFAQMLSDKDCEEFVESQAEAFRHYAEGDEIIEHFIQRSKDIVEEKNFKLK
jgi:hypothetical protein